jgi:bis(5'-nucleosyl)-tetraphosphatase (symmetrical)
MYADELSQQLQADPQHFLPNMYAKHPLAWSENLDQSQRQRYAINAFTRLRFCNAEGELDLTNKTNVAKPPFQAWFAIPNRKTANDNIIFGHWHISQEDIGTNIERKNYGSSNNKIKGRRSGFAIHN